MSLLRTIKRCTNTAVRLPFAMAWDVISLGNMGDGASTAKVLREHEAIKEVDDWLDAADKLRELEGRNG